jgi:hypothetical protein
MKGTKNMNEKVMKKLERIIHLVEKIESDADYVKEIVDRVEESEDLPIIETTLENIERWARDARNVCRNTYDDFEEEG